jgi:hypothetical protein
MMSKKGSMRSSSDFLGRRDRCCAVPLFSVGYIVRWVRRRAASLPTNQASYVGVYEHDAPGIRTDRRFRESGGQTANLVGYYSGWRSP